MPEWDHAELMTATFTHESAASRLRGRINGIDGHITRPPPTAYPPPREYPTPLGEETKVPDPAGEGQPPSHDAAPQRPVTSLDDIPRLAIPRRRGRPRVSKGKLVIALPARNTTGEATDALLAPGPTPMTDLLALLPRQPKTKFPEGEIRIEEARHQRHLREELLLESGGDVRTRQGVG